MDLFLDPRLDLDDVGPTFFLQKMLHESFKKFKHFSNILLLISRVRWYWMRLCALPACWTNFHAKKMSISLRFEYLNVDFALDWIWFWMFWNLYVFFIHDVIILLSNKMEPSSEDVKQINNETKQVINGRNEKRSGKTMTTRHRFLLKF